MFPDLILGKPQARAPPLNRIRRQIKIHHPGYEDKIPLISLPGYDSEEGHLWHDIARVACAIITNNRFDGWLSTSGDPESPHYLGDLLAPGDYWWHLPEGDRTSSRRAICYLCLVGSTPPYPIVPDFRTWRFPSSVPDAWSSHDIEKAAETACQVSGDEHALNQAHVVPSLETDWFNKNDLGPPYCSEQSKTNLSKAGIDHKNNMVTLRADLHTAWDRRVFTFVPKRTGEGTEVVLHCWEDVMVKRYHNMILQGFKIEELLLARFAWSLYPWVLNRFLAATKGTRMLWVEDVDGKLVAKKKSAQECAVIANAPIPRSTSPKKRKQGDDAQKDDEDVEYDDSSDSDSDSSCSIVEADYTRGRKRFRTGESWCSSHKPVLVQV